MFPLRHQGVVARFIRPPCRDQDVFGSTGECTAVRLTGEAGLCFVIGAVREKLLQEKVIGLALEGKTKAYPFAELSQLDTPFTDQVAGREITVHFDPGNRTGRILDAEGNEIPSVIAFWFAWVAFHPDTTVYRAF